jgi:hypothetical protein
LFNGCVKLVNRVVTTHHGLGRPKLVVVKKRDHAIEPLLSTSVGSQASLALLKSISDLLVVGLWCLQEAAEEALFKWIQRNFSQLLLDVRSEFFLGSVHVARFLLFLNCRGHRELGRCVGFRFDHFVVGYDLYL